MKQAILIAAVLGTIDPTCTIEKVCTPDYTETVRPSNFYTRNLKIIQMDAMELPGEAKDYELDHAESLELCGAPRDPNNLWPQPWPEARKKDKLENFLHRQVCNGKITLEEAQKEVWPNWEFYYAKHFGKAL